MSDPSNPSPSRDGDMTIQVEFTGLCRAIVGGRRSQITLPRGTSYRGVIQRLAELYPGLVEVVIAPNREELLNANIISRNGDELIMPDMLDRCPEDGDTLMILSIIVGG